MHLQVAFMFHLHWIIKNISREIILYLLCLSLYVLVLCWFNRNRFNKIWISIDDTTTANLFWFRSDFPL